MSLTLSMLAPPSDAFGSTAPSCFSTLASILDALMAVSTSNSIQAPPHTRSLVEFRYLAARLSACQSTDKSRSCGGRAAALLGAPPKRHGRTAATGGSQERHQARPVR